MSDNKHTIPVRAIEPSDNFRQGSAPDSVRWSRVSTNADDQLVREYREAFLMIYKVHGQMKGVGSEGKLIELSLSVYPPLFATRARYAL